MLVRYGEVYAEYRRLTPMFITRPRLVYLGPVRRIWGASTSCNLGDLLMDSTTLLLAIVALVLVACCLVPMLMMHRRQNDKTRTGAADRSDRHSNR